MPLMDQGDYVLGTHDHEVWRLGLQHRVWRERMLGCWRRAGFRGGHSLMDVGAGPGYASFDLAEIVGLQGRVHAMERSPRFVAAGQERCRRIVEYHQIDLVEDELPVADQDGAWCRWVLSFVSDPETVVKKVARALKKGGAFALHEYLDYGTWRLLSGGSALSGFVAKTIESWSLTGGCANIGAEVPEMLQRNGFQIKSVEPIVFAMTPQDFAWQWPKEFALSGSSRLVETGLMSDAERARLIEELDNAERSPKSLMVSPTVLEVIAERV